MVGVFLGVKGLGCFRVFRVFGGWLGFRRSFRVGASGSYSLKLIAEGFPVWAFFLGGWGGGGLGLSLELRARSLGLETRRFLCQGTGVSRTCAFEPPNIGALIYII